MLPTEHRPRLQPDGSAPGGWLTPSGGVEPGWAGGVSVALAERAGGDPVARDGELLARVAAMVRRVEDPGIAVPEVLAGLCHLLGWPAAHLLLTGSGSAVRLRPAGWVHLEADDARVLAALASIPRDCGRCLPARALAAGRVVAGRVVAGHDGALVGEERCRCSSIAAAGLRSGIACPLRCGRATVGVLELYRPHPEPPDAGAVAAVEVVRTVMADALGQRQRRLLERRRLDAQQRLLSVTVHDLAQPVAVIHALAETLVESGELLDADQHRDAAARILRQSSRLFELVDGVLANMRLDAGVVVPELRCVELADLVTGWVDEVRGTRSGRGLEVRAQPTQACTDPSLLRRVVTNLLANALEHGAPPVTVEVRPADGLDAVVAIRDHGPGVPASFVPRLFERFARGDERATRGAGLGLSIVSELLDQLGGSIAYEDVQPGARFVVRLPGPADDGPREGSADVPARGAGSAGVPPLTPEELLGFEGAAPRDRGEREPAAATARSVPPGTRGTSR